MLRAVHALPTEARVQEMRERDYVWCLANLMLDEEELQDALCPQCRAALEQACCPGCGKPTGQSEGAKNPAFDESRFLRMQRGEMP